MIQLYPHQETQITETKRALQNHKSVLLQLSTGGGKTVMASHMIASSQAKGKKSLFIVPRRELVTQVSNTLQRFDVPHSFVVSGKAFNPFARTHIATMQTLHKRLDCINPDVVFADECHYGGKQLDKSLMYYKERDKYMIGLSATPMRNDGRGLGCWFGKMVQGASIAYLIENGFLSQYRAFAAQKPSGLSGLKMRGGDYAQDELAELMESDGALIGDAVQEWLRHAAGKRTVVFCVSRKHAKIVQARFTDSGIPCGYVDGAMRDNERRVEIEAFAKGEKPVLVSVNLLQFGFDLASAVGYDVTIEAMLDLQPTKSLSMQLQKWGRVLRRKLEAAVILDCAGNIAEHGLPDDARNWTLADRKKSTKGDAAAKDELEQQTTCKGCKSSYARTKSHCPYCGLARPLNERIIDEIEGELKEIDPKTLVRQRKVEQAKAGTLEDLIALGKQRGMKHPEKWGAYIMSARNAKKRK